MCGVVAIVTADPGFNPMVLDTMRDRVAHRGPDGAASWVGKSEHGIIALGHRRLSIIDLSDGGAQPMHSSDGRCVISYNGEIYNYVELREELVRLGVSFRSQCDTEVLLNAYLTWGEDCLKRLNGMFAFVIWDYAKQTMLVARDRLGEKPLYYAELPKGGMAFASEMKGLLAHPDIAPLVDEDALDVYCNGGALPIGIDTLFRNVKRVPPATIMVVDASGRIRKSERYWIPQFDSVRPYNERDAVAEFSHLLKESVRKRLRADVAVGACLSGGLDSSCLVGMIAKLDGGRYPGSTYSVRFDEDPDISEGHYIDIMNRWTGAAPVDVPTDPDELTELSRALHWHQEEPFASPSMYLEWCVMRSARERNDVVLINGQGADELLGGYSSYFQYAQLDWLRRGNYGVALKETGLWALRAYLASRRYADSQRRTGLKIGQHIKWAFTTWLRTPDLEKPRGVGVPSALAGNSFRHLISTGLQYSILPEQLHSADRNGMAFGIETRFPFLDYDLVDWCIGLPLEAMMHNGWQKYILRRATEDVVPPSIGWRADKVGFSAPFDSWMRGSMKEWCERRLFEGPITSLRSYDRDVIRRLWEGVQQGGGLEHWRIWRWISVNEWLSLATDGVWNTGVKMQYAPRGV